MFLSVLFACALEGSAVELTVEPVAGTSPLRCGEEAEVQGHEVTLQDFRWFVHRVQVVGADGAAHPLLLTEDAWQHDGIALLDHEDGCHNGTAATHPTLRGTTRAQPPYRAVRLRVGLPPAHNHADPLRQAPPLTTSAMHWGWRQGHKYVRFDFVHDGVPTRVHLGATGCAGPMGAVSGCTAPNLGDLQLPIDGTTARLDLSEALAATSGGCMAEPGDRSCEPWLTAFGIPPADLAVVLR